MDVKKFRDRTFPVYRDILEGRVEPVPQSNVETMIFQKGMPKILITNVIEYFAEHWRDTSKMLNNIPNAAPPFNMCWFEGVIPDTGYDITAAGPTHIGATYVALDILDPEHSDRTEPGLTDQERKLFSHHKYDDSNIRWITHTVCACKPPRSYGYEKTWAPTQHLLQLVNRDGSVAMSVVAGFGTFKDEYTETLTPELQNQARIIQLFSMIPPILAISFLHCKNVELVDREQIFHLDKRQNGARLKKKSRLAKVRYHMLTVEPIRKVLAGEGQIGKVGMEKALHICRGHFKDYREHGLFGRYKGIYWWNQSLRGSKERGVMIKDYKELAPK